MAKTRHPDEPAVRGYAVTHPPGRAVLPVEPGWDQVLYTASGTMTVLAPTGSWTIPPHRAIWIREPAPVTVHNRFRVAVRALYIASDLHALPDTTKTLAISGFVRELLLHVVRRCPLDIADPVQSALITVLLDGLGRLPEAALWLPTPVEPRASDAARILRDNPLLAVAAVARTVGASQRTLERAFLTDTGVSLGAWRRRLRILTSLDYLGDGLSVTDTAIAVGYGSASAFVTAFRRELGHTPRRFAHS